MCCRENEHVGTTEYHGVAGGVSDGLGGGGTGRRRTFQAMSLNGSVHTGVCKREESTVTAP